MVGRTTITVLDLRQIDVGEIEVTLGITRGSASMRATITYPMDTHLGALRMARRRLRSAGYIAIGEFVKVDSLEVDRITIAIEKYQARHGPR